AEAHCESRRTAPDRAVRSGPQSAPLSERVNHPLVSLAAVERRGALRDLERRVEQAEPAGQVRLDRELLVELRLQLELLGVVAILLARGDERPESALLVAVDPVDRLAVPELGLKLERRRQQLLAEAGLLQALADRVDGRHLVLEIGVANDDPLVAEVVGLALEPRAGLPRDRVEYLLQVVLGQDELAR